MASDGKRSLASSRDGIADGCPSSDAPAILLKTLDYVANFHADHCPLTAIHWSSSTAASTPAPAPCSLPSRPREPFPSSDTGSRGWCAPEYRRDRFLKFAWRQRSLRRSG